MSIVVYSAEREAGLEAAVARSRCAVLTAELRLAPASELSGADLERTLARARMATAASLGDPDLFHLEAIHVTAGWEMDAARGVPAGWNNNDDFFDPVEVWAARRTPEDKPLNDEHDCSRVIGHLTGNQAVLDDGSVVAETSAVDELPGRYHLLTSGVVYKVWNKEEVQKAVDELLAEIAQGKRAVSMECLFCGFDYAVVEGGVARAIARTKQTAFLTKHLRAYGGDGTFQGKRVGRLMRNLSFSGQGVVRRPANPASVILTTSGSEKTTSGPTAGYSTSNATRETTMANENELQKQLDELKATNQRLAADLAGAQEQAVVATRKCEQAGASLEAATKEKDSLAARVAALEGEMAADRDALGSARAELAQLKLEKTQSKRSADLAKALGVDLDAAAAMAGPLAELSDENFAAHVQAMQAVTNNPQSGNVSFPHGQIKQQPKSTTAPVGPTSTNKPAPMRGKASEGDLEGAQVAPEPAMAADADAGSEGVRQAIAAYFGRGEKKKSD